MYVYTSLFISTFVLIKRPVYYACYQYKFCTDNESLLEYVLIPSHVHRPRYQYICTDNEACTDKFCTDSESQKGGLVIGTVPITRPQCIR